MLTLAVCCWPAGQAEENKIESSPQSAAAPDIQREVYTKEKQAQDSFEGKACT